MDIITVLQRMNWKTIEIHQIYGNVEKKWSVANKVQEHAAKMHELLLYGLISVSIISLFLCDRLTKVSKVCVEGQIGPNLNQVCGVLFKSWAEDIGIKPN